MEKGLEEKKLKLDILKRTLQDIKYKADEKILEEETNEYEERKRLEEEDKQPEVEMPQHKKDEELTKRKKKVNEVISNTILSISRIASQLKEDNNITPQNCDNKLSLCGLRLEHMVATLYKKRPTFNIESVNTDYSSNFPPLFLGIKNQAFVEAFDKNIDHMSDLERLQLNQEQKVVEVDEVDELFNEEYSKKKQMMKVME